MASIKEVANTIREALISEATNHPSRSSASLLTLAKEGTDEELIRFGQLVRILGSPSLEDWMDPTNKALG